MIRCTPPDSSYMRHLTSSSLAVPCRRTVSCLRRASQPAASPVRVQAHSTKNMLCEPQQAPTIKEGDKLPEGTFSMLPEGVPPPPAGKDDPIQVQLYGDIIKKGKNRVVVFGLPVPQYSEHADDLKALGVSSIHCLSVNDPYVMRDWEQHLNATGKVQLLADGEGVYHAKIGLLQHLPGLGWRARRYSMLLDDEGRVQILNIEAPGGKSYKVSGPEHMMQQIKEMDAKGRAPA